MHESRISPLPQLQSLLDASLERFCLDPLGDHGPIHWQRVHHNGLLLAEAEGVSPLIPGCFAFLHDSCRQAEFRDPGHGARAAAFALELRSADVLPPLSETEFELLLYACRHHSGRLLEAPPEVMVCWDADRLDLARVGIRPLPERLSTCFAREESTIEAACRRALGG